MADQSNTHSLNEGSYCLHEEIIVTSRQYLAVADDFIRRVFPEFTPDVFPYPGHFNLFIKDGDKLMRPFEEDSSC